MGKVRSRKVIKEVAQTVIEASAKDADFVDRLIEEYFPSMFSCVATGPRDFRIQSICYRWALTAHYAPYVPFQPCRVDYWIVKSGGITATCGPEQAMFYLEEHLRFIADRTPDPAYNPLY